MHTAHALTVSPNMLCTWGGGACSQGGAWLGGACSGGVTGLGGAWSWGMGGIPACTEADPPVNRITHACENVTLPQFRCGR